MHDAQGRTLTIGALARAAGVGVETIRYYERRGLLPDPPRSAAGHRRYPVGSIDRVEFIRRAKDLGFTLREISELIDLRVEDGAPCAPVEARAREKLARVAKKIEELRRIQASLERLVEACVANQPTGECPMLEELERGEPVPVPQGLR